MGDPAIPSAKLNKPDKPDKIAERKAQVIITDDAQAADKLVSVETPYA